MRFSVAVLLWVVGASCQGIQWKFPKEPFFYRMHRTATHKTSEQFIKLTCEALPLGRIQCEQLSVELDYSRCSVEVSRPIDARTVVYWSHLNYYQAQIRSKEGAQIEVLFDEHEIIHKEGKKDRVGKRNDGAMIENLPTSVCKRWSLRFR